MMHLARAIASASVVIAMLGAWSPTTMTSLYDDPIELEEGTTRTRTADSVSDIRLMPELEDLQTRVAAELEEINERIVVESIRRIAVIGETPDGLRGSGNGRDWSDFDEQRSRQQAVAVANIFRNISSMEGITYYSERRDRMRTLFERSTQIESADDPTPVTSEPLSTIPQEETVYALQEDLTFGENIYRFHYTSLQNGQLLSIQNVDRLSYGFLPAIGSDQLRMFVAAVPLEDGILFYGAAAVQLPSLLGLGNRVATSFENRVNALALWFEDMYARYEQEARIAPMD